MSDCYHCRYLDKSKKEESHVGVDCILYGCAKRGKVVGWVRTEAQLREQWCSDFSDGEDEQLSMFGGDK